MDETRIGAAITYVRELFAANADGHDAEHSLRVYRTARRLAAGDVSLATINTKLNWLIGLLSAIGAAVLSAALKLAVG